MKRKKTVITDDTSAEIGGLFQGSDGKKSSRWSYWLGAWNASNAGQWFDTADEAYTAAEKQADEVSHG